MALISLEGVKKYMDTTLVLKDITFMVGDGEKVGIVGENGCGKTTILKLIAGILKLNHCPGYPYAPVPPGYDEGWVKLSKNTTCSYLNQILQYSDNMKVIDVLNLSFEELYHIEKEIHQLEHSMMDLEGIELKKTLAKYSDLVQIFETKGGYTMKEKLDKICKGLKFSDSFLNQDFNLLSGGEKTTVALGKLLIDTPDILLLDEPTNHLDIDAVEWLEAYIRNYKGIVIVVSHDRYFLDHTVNKIVEVEHKVCKTYLGNYSDYITQKEENLRIQYNDYKDQKKKIDSIEQSIKELKDWAGRGNSHKLHKRATSMQIKLDKMERMEKPVLNKANIKLNIKTSERSGTIVIKASNLSKSYESKLLLKEADLLIQYGERVALIGPNGCGKTTFLKMLLGEAVPDQGEISLGSNIRMAYLPQNIAFCNEELTVLEYFRDDILILEEKAREHLAKFMFGGGNVFKKIKLLSGGERVRLLLSKILIKEVNLLILDEPTNHLDTASIESIEKALLSFKGTIVLISHDRYFINRISDRIIEIEDHSFKNYPGNYEYYKEEKTKQAIHSEQDTNLSTDKNVQREGNIKSSGYSNRSKNEKTAKNKEDSSIIESRVEEIENKIKEIEYLMEASGADYEELNKLYIKKEELNKELDLLLHQWITR